MLPIAKKILNINNFKMQILFDNNEIREFEAKSIWDDKFWQSLKNKAIFESAYIDGISISWINDIDISPEDLYYLSQNINN